MFSATKSAFGVLVWVLYLQHKLEEVDTVNLIMGIWLGFADSYVCWMEGGWLDVYLLGHFLLGGNILRKTSSWVPLVFKSDHVAWDVSQN